MLSATQRVVFVALAAVGASLAASADASLVSQQFDGRLGATFRTPCSPNCFSQPSLGPFSVGDIWHLQFTYESNTPNTATPTPEFQGLVGHYADAITDLRLS